MSHSVLRASDRAWIRSWEWAIRVTSEPRVIHQNTTKTEKSFGVHLGIKLAQAAVLNTNGGGEIAPDLEIMYLMSF